MANELADLQAASDKIAKGVVDVGAAIKALAAEVANMTAGVDPVQVEALAQKISAQGDALEALVPAPPAGP